MAEYDLLISGVYYGANGDSVAGQKETEEMHERTRVHNVPVPVCNTAKVQKI
jgi:hypothetical protein